MVPSRQGGAEAPRPTGGSPWPSIVHASGSAATREPRRYARRRGSWPPRGLSGPADSRPPGGGRRARRGGPCATRPGRGGRPGQGVPERAGGLRGPDRATGDLTCVREAARQRAGATLCRHGMSRDGRTPTGGPERRRCRHLRDRPRPVGLGDAGLRGLPRGSLGRRVGRGRLRRAGGQGRGGRQGLRPGAAR